MATPRGIRNNNPCNIRRTADKWLGLSANQTDPSFCVFTSMEWGLRAALVIVRNYIRKYKLRTISQIIQRWAPVSENNTTAYINFVAKKSLIGANTQIDYRNKNQMCRVIWAMAWYENGQAISFGRVENAWALV